MINLSKDYNNKKKKYIRGIEMKKCIKVFLIIIVLELLIGCGRDNNSIVQPKNDEIKVKEKDDTKREEEIGKVASHNQLEYVEGQDNSKLSVEEQIENNMKQMTIEEKIGQIFIIAIRKDSKGEPITQMNEELKMLLTKYPVGGIILFKENIISINQTKALIDGAQGCSKIPLFIGVDEEGGKVSRVGSNEGINKVPFKSAFNIGQTGDTRVAFEEAKRMGKLLNTLGFNMDFAPVADIYNEPSNTVIGKRSFGITAQEVIPMVITFAKGLQEEGIQPVLKHFPGHGNTLEDSHEGLAYVNKSLEELEKEELRPFEAGLDSGIGALMRGHLVVKGVDQVMPASLSKVWGEYITTHYDSEDILLMTDAMDMGAIQNKYTVEEATLLCIEAGNDICLMPADIEKAYNALLKAYKEGKLTEERINCSVKKILSKKVAQNILVLE